MHLPRSRRVVTAGIVGVVAALGAGAVFGLVGNAGAASGRATAASHVTGARTASFNFSVSITGLTPSDRDHHRIGPGRRGHRCRLADRATPGRGSQAAPRRGGGSRSGQSGVGQRHPLPERPRPFHPGRQAVDCGIDTGHRPLPGFGHLLQGGLGARRRQLHHRPGPLPPRHRDPAGHLHGRRGYRHRPQDRDHGGPREGAP